MPRLRRMGSERAKIEQRPLVVLGLDAGDPALIARWVREGRLPNIAGLMERGTWAETGGAELYCEHGIWLSLLSGASRGEHGCYHWRRLVPGTYEVEVRASTA